VFLASSNDSTTSFAFDLTLIFSLFSFLLTFTREIIKDLEDIDGDKLMNSQNIASKLNLDQSKQIIIGVLILDLFLMLIGCYYFSSEILILKPISIFMYSSLLFFMSLFSIFKVKNSKEKKDYIYISRLLKLIMLLGVLSIPIIYYI
jgi:4-hydroxybenzoate polyprenyltransferase